MTSDGDIVMTVNRATYRISGNAVPSGRCDKNRQLERQRGIATQGNRAFAGARFAYPFRISFRRPPKRYGEQHVELRYAADCN